MKLLSIGLTAVLGLLCLLISCKNPTTPETPPVINYTVSFQSDGGTPIADIKNVPQGTVLRVSSSDYWPKRPGYLFDGWYLQGDTNQRLLRSIRVNGNITLVAKWIKLFTVKLEMGEGGTLGGNLPLTFLPGALFEASSYRPFRKGFLFLYWYEKDKLPKAPVGTFQVDKDITLVAEWEEGWTVSLELNGGTYSRNYVTVAKRDNATISLAGINLVREGYIFEGWYYDAAFTNPVPGDTIPVTEDFTLYVKWTSLSVYSAMLGVWTAGNDGPAYFLYHEESRLYGFYFSPDDIRSFVWSTSILDGKRYTSAPRTLRVGEGEDAKTFTPVTEKRKPSGNVPLNGVWLMAEADADLLALYFGGGIMIYLSSDIDERKNLIGSGSIRANGRYLNISYVVTGSGYLYLLQKNVGAYGVLLEGEVLLRIPIVVDVVDGKEQPPRPDGYQKYSMSGPVHVF
jgi:uncharacterized repeat protein (TIGR02543 family)